MLVGPRSERVAAQPEIKQETIIPSPPPDKVQKRIRVTPTGRINAEGAPRVADAVKCQEIALWFEQHPDQNRFPLRVDHIQGKEGYGCDVPSFASAADREQFVKERNLALIARFIEVKGRSAERGTVRLEGNELESAMTHRERFYIYRIYEGETQGAFKIAILPDPLSTTYRAVYEFDPFREASTECWSITGVDLDSSVRTVAPSERPDPAAGED